MRVRVVGVDPGLTRLGFAVVEEVGGRLAALAGGCAGTRAGTPTALRLLEVWNALNEVVERFRPDALAVERVFYNLNVRTAVPVAQAAGVALLAGARAGVEVHEYTPLEIKQAVVGTGSATKEQVRFMVHRLLGLGEAPETADAADAYAAAICHLHSYRMRRLAAAKGDARRPAGGRRP